MTGERFVYVCCATENQLINLVPLLELGLDRIARVIMLVGTHNPPTENDRAKALIPTEHFHGTLRNIARRTGAKPPDFVKMKRRPDDTDSWQRAVIEALREVENAEVVFNVTSGTRSMMFGAMLGVDAARPSDSWKAVIYLTNPARTEQLRPIPERRPNYLASVDFLELDDLLSLRGYERRQSRQSDDHQAHALRRQKFTRWMVGELSSRASQEMRNQRARVLHGAIGEVEDREGPGRKEADWRRFPSDRWTHATCNRYKNGKGHSHGSGLFWKDRVFLNTHAPPHDDLYRSGSRQIELHGKQATEYFTGGWFEEYIFLLCYDILGSRPDIRLYTKVRYADPETARAHEDGEIDVIIKAGNDLHLIECKARRVASRNNPDGINRETIHTISTRRRQICAGGPGSGRVVSYQTGYKRFPGDLEREAGSAQVKIYFGERGIGEFKSWLRSLC